MSAVLVTGATGNVGAAVVAQLEARGVDVLAPRRAELDFLDPATFEGSLSRAKRVFLMRPPSMSDATLMRPFIRAMVAAGVKHVVFLSVQGAGSNPFVPHHGIEQDLRKSGLAWTFLRPSFFMQNLSTTHVGDIRDRDEVFVPAGRGRTNFIDVADIALAAALTLTEPGHVGKAYELTGSEALTYDEVAAILSAVCDRTIVYARPSKRAFAERMTEQGHAEEYVGVMARIYLIAKLGMAAGTTREFEQLTGTAPRTFRQWAAENATCFQRRG